MANKVKHYSDAMHEYDKTGDEKLHKKARYGSGYIDGFMGKQKETHGGMLAPYYEFGYEAGVKDKATENKKGGR